MPIISWNRAKSARNVAMGRPAFWRFRDMDFTTAVYRPSPRHGEDRIEVQALLDGRLHLAVYLAAPNRRHVISLRPASRKERRTYATHRSR